ncbi:MAG: hypothetical protein ABL925_08570 [Methylococcales bacterium]
MKSKYNLLPVLAMACLSPLSVQAAGSFNSFANINFTINNLNDLTGLDISENFALDDTQTVNALSGDASSSYLFTPAVSANNFQVSGNADHGSAVVSYLAAHSIAFTNNTVNSYQISLTMAYQLSASAVGDNAESQILLDFYNALNTDTGQNQTYATSVAPQGTENVSGTHTFSFTLSPGQAETISADANITGNIAPVPLPGAVWLFSSAVLSGIGYSKRRKNA